MKIYLVQSTYFDYECSGETPIKAFVKKEKAQELVDDIVLKSMMLREELKKLFSEYGKKTRDLRNLIRLRAQNKEALQKITDLNSERIKKEKEIREKYKLDDCFISDEERYGIEIEEIELDES